MAVVGPGHRLATQAESMAQVEYDCVDRRMRTLKATGKSLRMAGGEIIQLNIFSDEWIGLRPGKDDEATLKVLDTVCAPPRN